MASRAAVLGGSQPHQLSPIDFEDKSGPDGSRNGDFLGHILWGTWGGGPQDLHVPLLAFLLSEIKRILARQSMSAGSPISL